MTMLTQIFSKYISKIKGHDYHIDGRIPASYLLGLSVSHMLMKFRGWACNIRSKGIPFIGYHVKIKAKSKIVMGYGVSIGHNCYIDALSTDGIEFGNNVSVGPNTKIEC